VLGWYGEWRSAVFYSGGEEEVGSGDHGFAVRVPWTGETGFQLW
jgi:hypothetical protein